MDQTGSNVYKGMVGLFPIYDPKGGMDDGDETTGLHLPGVEPESVSQRAAVELDGGLLPSGGDAELPAAAGATPPAALARSGVSKSEAEPFRRTTLEPRDLLQLAGVEPGASAGKAAVDLHPIELEDEHRLPALWTHRGLLGRGVYPDRRHCGGRSAFAEGHERRQRPASARGAGGLGLDNRRCRPLE